MEEVEFVIYDITFAEINKNAIDPAASSHAGRSGLGSFLALESNDVTGFVFTASDVATYFLLHELERENKLSHLMRPRVLCNIGTPARIITGEKASKYEIELHPVRHENGRILTKIVVKQTDSCNGNEETPQSEMLVSLLDLNRSSLVMGGKLGDKEVILFVRVAVATMYDPQRRE